MDIIDQIESVKHESLQAKQTTAPTEFRTSGVEFRGDSSVITTPAYDPANPPSTVEMIEAEGFDASEWVVTDVRIGEWGPETAKSKSTRLVMKRREGVDTTDEILKKDFDDLVEEIRAWKPSGASKIRNSSGAYCHVNADQQYGKKTGRGGTRDVIQRSLDLTDNSATHFNNLRKMGLKLGTVVMPSVGDHIEGNVSQNGRVQGVAASDLGITSQVRVARRLMLRQIKTFIETGAEVHIAVVNGNHDASTRQVLADPLDGWNVEITAAVQDACEENKDLKNVKFYYPASGDEVLAFEVPDAGQRIGIFHGHQLGNSSEPAVRKFLSGHALGRTAFGDSDVWVSGHFHHFQARDFSDRVWFQAPTIDTGSDFFRNVTGEDSRPGLLTFVVGENIDAREYVRVIPA